ncbi:hypothetical protein N8H22_13715 [Stutzerimonas stutzeri]|uniref:hypothetical protein n=1 Tax=Stutzerimonas sp. S1 TaxID=3030652 RepID=UPI0022246057|nr:hypothetical protein [Stutzerimonas sp. S1]MCW3149657.1 hypothetical protein [Stutzerimonas sp. S1]
MIRIRGHIGEWPVDLKIELDEQDWAHLTRQLSVAPGEPAAGTATPVDDSLWHTARERLRRAGRLDGPELFAELEALTGSASMAKRLLVRLRHCDQVRVESGSNAASYHWIGEGCPTS